MSYMTHNEWKALVLSLYLQIVLENYTHYTPLSFKPVVVEPFHSSLCLTQPLVVLFMFKFKSNPDKLSKLDIDGWKS